MTDINKLKELAERYIANPSGAGGEDSAFRAAANPQAILKLIAEVDLLSARLKAENCAHKDTQKHCELLEQYLKVRKRPAWHLLHGPSRRRQCQHTRADSAHGEGCRSLPVAARARPRNDQTRRRIRRDDPGEHRTQPGRPRR